MPCALLLYTLVLLTKGFCDSDRGETIKLLLILRGGVVGWGYWGVCGVWVKVGTNP